MFEEYQTDFGRDQQFVPDIVTKPNSLKNLQQILKNTLSNMKIAVRGKAHSTGGLTLVNAGTVIDMQSYNKIGPINKQFEVELQAGALWKDIFNFCLKENLMPPTYADWLDLTVGGTISTGGVGQTTFKKGLQIDNVRQLEIVTLQGETLICNSHNNKDLFNFVRGGYGKFGIISRVWMRLEKAPKNVFVYKLFYTELESFLKAQTQLTDFNQVDAIQSHIILAIPEELRKRLGPLFSEDILELLPKQSQYFVLEITKYVDEHYTKDSFEDFIKYSLTYKPVKLFAYEHSFNEHVNRVPPLLSNPLEQSSPRHHHCCFFIAANKSHDLLKHVFAHNDHCQAMGQGTILIIPMKRSKIKAAYFMLPEGENLFFIGILRRHVLPYSFEKLININELTYQIAIQSGGKIYPVGSGSFLLNPNYWKEHYGQNYIDVLNAQNFIDPHNQLTPSINFATIDSTFFDSNFKKDN